MPDAPVTADALPPTCNVLGWVVFTSGPHKDGKDYYTPRMVERIAENFKRLPGTVPQAKLGHDRRQLMAERLKQSLGFPSVGQVTRCDPVPGFPGCIEIDVRNVPTRAVGGEIAAGRYNSGSVELKPSALDPKDPGKAVEGPILTGVAFLGEEQPAVSNFPDELLARMRPVATFDDGSPVPPNRDVPPEVLSAMSDVSRQIAREFSGEYDPDRRVVRVRDREFSESVACFSDLPPTPQPGANMTPEQKAQLQASGFTPDQIAKMEASLAPAAMAEPAVAAPALPAPAAPGDAFADCMKYADDPAATPEQKLMAAMAKKFSDENADLKKRVGAFEASAEAAQKKDEEAKMAAFSAQVETACKRFAAKVEPAVVAAVHKPTLLGILTAKTFSSEADRLKTFSDYADRLAALPDDPRLLESGKSAVAAGRGRQLTPLAARIVRPDGVVAREMPGAAKAIRESAAA